MVYLPLNGVWEEDPGQALLPFFLFGGDFVPTGSRVFYQNGFLGTQKDPLQVLIADIVGDDPCQAAGVVLTAI